jgi:hypothetical protein
MTGIRLEKRTIKSWIVSVVAALFILTGLFWDRITHHGTADVSDPAVNTADGKSAGQLDEKTLEIQQADAAKAALTSKPLTGPVFSRPEFVSDMEWQVLQGAAKAQTKDGPVITQLLNKLLFHKKREAWMAMRTISDNPEARRDLAKQLLEEIPGQLKDKSIDEAFARKMKSELLADLKN